MSLNVLGKNWYILNNFSQNTLGNGITDTISWNQKGPMSINPHYFSISLKYVPMHLT